MTFPGPGTAHVLLLSDALVIALAVFFVFFALAVVFVAFWYHMRQDKQVRMDHEPGDDDEEDEDFMSRPGEDDEEDEEDQDGVESGTERFRRS